MIERAERVPNSNHIPPRAPGSKPSSNNTLLKPDQMAKIFGTQENFNMIKSLMHSQQNFSKALQLDAAKRKEQRQGAAGRYPPENKPINLESEEQDIKVEKALLDLNQLKSEQETQKQ